MVHLGDSSNDIWHSTFDGSAWSSNIRIKNQRSHAAPALAAYQGRLHLVHLGDSSNQLWHSIFDGTWRPNVQIENQSSSTSAGIAAYGNQLVMVHVGNGSASLWHSVHTRWPAGIAEGDLIKSPGDPRVYLVENRTKRWIPDEATLLSRWTWDMVKVVPDEAVNAIPTGPDVPSVG